MVTIEGYPGAIGGYVAVGRGGVLSNSRQQQARLGRSY